MTDDNPQTDDQEHRDTTNESTAVGPVTGAMQIELQWTPTYGPRRRFRFRQRTEGHEWWQIEAEWTGCRWRHVGQALVTDVSVTVTERN